MARRTSKLINGRSYRLRAATLALVALTCAVTTLVSLFPCAARTTETQDGGGFPAAFVPAPGRAHADDLAQAVATAAAVGAGGALWPDVATAVSDASQMPPAPSGVNTLPESAQAAVFFACYVVIGTFAYGITAFFSVLRSALPEGWFENWRKTWPILGATFMAAGAAHFGVPDAFYSMYPPPGTWGIWYLPGSAEFHVAWTGVAELLGGAALFIGAIAIGVASALGKDVPLQIKQLHAASALGLFVLTLAVTPANIFMYTHGAQMVGLTPGDVPVPVTGHYARAVLQGVILAILWGYWEYANPKTTSSS